MPDDELTEPVKWMRSWHRRHKWVTLYRRPIESGQVEQKDRCIRCEARRTTRRWDPLLLPPIISRCWA